MAVNHSKLDDWELFVPKWEGQRDAYAAGDDDAVTMEVRLITKEQRDSYQRNHAKMERMGAANAADRKIARDTVADNVRNIKNYTAEGVAVTEGGQLYDLPGMDALLLEAVEAITERSSLEAGLGKRLRLLSDSTQEGQTSKSSGDAADAIPASPQTTPAATTQRSISGSQTS